MDETGNGIVIYRGSHQIGGCAAEIRSGSHRVVIDFGANLPDGGKGALSDEALLNTVFDGRPCDGVLFTHYHGDHVGLYRKIPDGVRLWIGPVARRILEILTEKLDSFPGTEAPGLSKVRAMNTYFPGRELTGFGGLKITPFIVDHSALDAYCFLIEAGGKRILYTGDFREHGIAGENGRLEKMLREYVGQVDILITEGTMLSRTAEAEGNPVRTEAELGRRARELFLKNRETVILVSSTNLDSIMEFYHALPWGMGFVCDAYQAKLILTAMEEKGPYYRKYCPELIYGKPRRLHIIGHPEGLGRAQNCDRADFDILKRKGFAMLARERGRIFREKLEQLSDPLIIYSKWMGYLKGKHEDPFIRSFIGNHRMEVLHTSGHAYIETIEKLIRLTGPKTIIPMHTEWAEAFLTLPAFAPYRDRIRVLSDREEYLF